MRAIRIATGTPTITPELLTSAEKLRYESYLRRVGEWATRRRRSERASKQQLQRIPSARTIAHLMTVNRNCMTEADAVVIAAIEAGVPSLIKARALVDQFHDMIRKKDRPNSTSGSQTQREASSHPSTGVLKDRSAVRAAIIQPRSNGQVEAQITKLKLVKRQMYGRAKIDLHEARLLGTA
jgi:transposase